MKVNIEVHEVEDSIELEYFLKCCRKLREQTSTCISNNFTMDIRSKLMV